MRNVATLAVLSLLLLSSLSTVVGESTDSDEVEVVIIDTDGVEHRVSVEIDSGDNAWNASMEAFEELNLTYNYSESEWGVMLSAIDGQSNDAAWGSPDFWYWSIYTDVEGNWSASMVGASAIDVADDDRILWFATDGTYDAGDCTVSEQQTAAANTTVSVQLLNGTIHNQTTWTNGCDSAMDVANGLAASSGVAMDATLGEWGWFVQSFDNTTSAAAWGELDYWWWGLFESVNGSWVQTYVGIGDVNLSEGAHYLFAPTFDGIHYGEHFEAELERRGTAQAEIDLCTAAAHQVGVGSDGISWSVDALSIEASESVCFSWSETAMSHNVVSVEDEESATADGIINSGELTDAEHFLHTFDENATVHIICEPHESMGMRMVITVGDGGLPDVTEDEPGEGSGEESTSNRTPGFTGVFGVLTLLGAAVLGRRKA